MLPVINVVDRYPNTSIYVRFGGIYLRRLCTNDEQRRIENDRRRYRNE